jgi:hypothetical protein
LTALLAAMNIFAGWSISRSLIRRKQADPEWARRYPREAGAAVRSLINIRRSTQMRFMVIVKADQDSEAGVMPSQQLLTDMGKFNEDLVKAGVMLAGDGLQPSSKGARVKFSGTERAVIKGPFTQTKDLVAGFWLWQTKSLDEAIDWLKRAPFDGGAEVEIRQVFEMDDFGAEFTPELREQELRTAAAMAENR